MPRLFGRHFLSGREAKVLVTDIDGVLAFSQEPVVSEVNKRWGLGLRHQDIDGWNWVSGQVARITGSQEEGEKAGGIWFEPEVLARSQPVEGAQEGIGQLSEAGWMVWAATSRFPNAKDSTLDWIDTYFPEIGAGRVYLREAGMENLVSSSEIKLLAVGMLGARLYVEDDPVTTEYVAENWGNGIVIAMLTRGWNKNDNKKLDEFRTDDWQGVVKKARLIR